MRYVVILQSIPCELYVTTELTVASIGGEAAAFRNCDKEALLATIAAAETVLWHQARGLYNVRVALTLLLTFLQAVSRLDLPPESYA